jgi:hypothetical protein
VDARVRLKQIAVGQRVQEVVRKRQAVGAAQSRKDCHRQLQLRRGPAGGIHEKLKQLDASVSHGGKRAWRGRR